jgi:protease secretion system outer membrane protein
LGKQLQWEKIEQQATIQRLEAELKQAANDYRRYRILADEGAIALADLEQRGLNVATAKQRLQEAQARLMKTEATLQEQIQQQKAITQKDAETLYQQAKEAQANLFKVSEVRNVDVLKSSSELNLALAEFNQAKAAVVKSDALLEKENASLITRLSGAYFDALLSLENIQYIHAQKTSLESQLAQANKRLKFGSGTITEINEAQANLDDVIAKSLEWANSLEYAKQALNNLTGTYPDQLLTLDATKLQLSMPVPDKVDAWISQGLEKNPDILAARQEVQIVMQEIEKNNAGHFPTLDLVVSKSDTKSDNNFTIGSNFQTDSIGLQLNVPIYLGGYVSASVRQSVARLNQAKEKLLQQERATSADIRKYFNAIQNGIAKVQAYQQSVKSNEIALIGTQKSFDAGLRTNVEVLNAQEKLYSAKRDLARERYEFLYNKILLKQSSGILTDDDIQEMSSLLSLYN